jgi:hypothetical protein
MWKVLDTGINAMKAMDCILFASPTLHSSNNQHASSNCGAAAPSIPPPLNNLVLAAGQL